MQVKLSDIARKTGYSITTVSRALAGYSDVNVQTRQRIIEVATQMGYQPHLVARQLRSHRTHTLGLIIPAVDRQSFSNDFFSQLMLGIGDVVSLERYALLISAQVPGEEEMAAYREMVGGQCVDGMILARTRQSDPRIAYLKARDFPFVVSGRSALGEESNFPYIDVDSQSGIRQAVVHLISLGHRDIGLILPPEEIAYTSHRHEGYREGLADAGIPYQAAYVVYGDLLRSGGYQGTQHLLDHHPQLTAIVACNDLMAFGAIRAIEERGLLVGSDIAVVGFDDIPPAEYAHPSLTTVRQPIYEIGQRLAAILLGMIAGHTDQLPQVVLLPTLIVRQSSGTKRR